MSIAATATLNHLPYVRVDDLEVLDTGHTLNSSATQVELLWYRTREWEAGALTEQYRVLAPLLLRYIPQESRKDTAYLDKMRTVLTGLYNQRRIEFDVVQILAGIWKPEPLGVAQIYGALTWDVDLPTAQDRARLAQAVLRATLSATFEQITLEPLPASQADWLLHTYSRMRYVTAVIGQPDERLAVKGMGREGPAEKMPASGEPGVTGQQLEMFLRGMAAQREEFVATLIASRISTTELSQWLMGLADEASVMASLQTGSESVSASLSLPLTMSANLGQSVASAFGQNRGIAYGQSHMQSQSRAHTVGYATSEGRTVTDGWAHSTGFSSSSGSSESTGISISTGSAQSTGTAHSTGAATTDGTTHTAGTAHSNSTSNTSGSFSSGGWSAGFSGGTSTTQGTSQGSSFGGGQSSGLAVGTSTGHTIGTSSGNTLSNASGTTTSQDWGVSAGVSGNVGANAAIGLPATLGGGVNAGVGASIGASYGESTGTSTSTVSGTSTGASVSDTTGGSVTMSDSSSTNWGESHATSSATGVNSGWSYGYSGSSGSSSSTTTSSGVTNSVSDSTSHAVSRSTGDTTSQGETASQGVTLSRSTGSFSSSTSSVSDTVSHAESFSTSTTRSTSDSTGESTSAGTSLTTSDGLSLGRSASFSQGMGLGFGAVTGFGIGRSYQWYNDQAIQLTNVLRAQEEQLRRATLEGAWLTDFYVMTATPTGAAAVDATVRQAFQGSGPQIITPVQTRALPQAEQDYLRLHAATFAPSTRLEPRRATYELYRDATTLLPIQLAAYMAPALFEEGLASTKLERLPALAFYPDMPGQMVWAQQISTETGQLTDTLLRVSPERFFHTVFAADTGFGKSVAAERLCVESTRVLKSRTIVLGFAPGWTKLQFAPGLQNRVITYQLQPGAVVPFRWNPWQVGKRIQPEQQLFATCEIFMNAGRMGERQYGYMVRAAERMWLEGGVLVNSDPVLNHRRWGEVQADEWAVLQPVWARHSLTRTVGGTLYLRDLTPWERQALAVFRSRNTGLPRWLELLREMLDGRLVPETNAKTGKVTQKQVGGFKHGTADYTSLEGLLLRLQVFGIGDLARQYAPGVDTVAVEDLGLLGPDGDQWGVAILEGGASMPSYPKAAIFGLVAWHLYHDAMARREEFINRWGANQVLQIYFEEANKILSGVDTGMSEGKSASASTTEQFQTMWRDGRRYQTYLHLMVQSPSELPAGILSSCSNAWVGQLKSPADRDVIMALLAWSEKGFVDEDYKRFISRMPKTYGIIKLGYTDDPVTTAPVLARALLLNTREATDAEILDAYRRLSGGQP